MKTIFYTIYLLYLFIMCIILFLTKKDILGKKLFFTTVMLFLGDICYIIPNAISEYKDINIKFVELGNLFHSIIFTMFIYGLYKIIKSIYHLNNHKHIDLTVNLLVIIRLLLCFIPFTQWNIIVPLKYRIIRNTPLALLMIIMILIFYKNRKKDKTFEYVWLDLFLAMILITPLVVGSQFIKNIEYLFLIRCMCYYFLVDSFYEEQSVKIKRAKTRRI